MYIKKKIDIIFLYRLICICSECALLLNNKTDNYNKYHMHWIEYYLTSSPIKCICYTYVHLDVFYC